MNNSLVNINFRLKIVKKLDAVIAFSSILKMYV